MIRELRPRAIDVQGPLDEASIRIALTNIVGDLSALADQWNEEIYPVVGSLPGGPVQLTAADRTNAISPVENGTDGSQVYMDMTSTPQSFGGLLHDGSRPRTIKEVVLNSHSSLTGRMSRLEALINALNVAVATPYDDTTLRNWIRQLAADTVWDGAQGDPYPSINFTGNPNKTAQYSLHDRDLNLRLILGIGPDYATTDLATNGTIATTNYLTTSNSFVEALWVLDAAIFSGAGGMLLQTTYENQVADEADNVGRIVTTTSQNPVAIQTGEDHLTGVYTETALELFGRLDFLGSNNVEMVRAAALSSYFANVGDGGDQQTDLFLVAGGLTKGGAERASFGGDESYARFTTSRPPATDWESWFRLKSAEPTPAQNTYPYIQLGEETGTGADFIYLYYSPSDAGIEFLDHFKLWRDSGNTWIELATTTEELKINSAADLTLYSPAGIDISCANGLLLESTVFNIGLTAKTDISLGAENDINISTTSGAPGGDINLTAEEDINLTATATIVLTGTGIEMRPSGTGDFDIYLDVSSDGRVFFTDSGAVITQYGTISGGEDFYSTTKWQSLAGASASTDGIAAQFSALFVTAYAPTQKDTGPDGALEIFGASPGGLPSVNAIYRENIVKAKGVIRYLDSAVDGTAVTSALAYDAFNVALDNHATPSRHATASSALEVRFLAPMPDAEYSVTYGIEHAGALYVGTITSKTINGFDLRIWEWDTAAVAFNAVFVSANGNKNPKVHFQVV